jgi:flagellar biosynthesis chaperone FliJ
MKRFRFSLEAVLRLRRVQADLARHALAQANRELERRRRERAEREAKLAALPVAALEGVVSVAAFEAEHLRGSLAAEALRASAEAFRQASAVAGQRRAAFLGATQRVSALERLEQRRRQAFVMGQRREEAAVLADLVAERYAGDPR